MKEVASGRARHRGHAGMKRASVVAGFAVGIALLAGALAGGAQQPKQKGKVVVNAVFKEQGKVNGLLYSKQRRQRQGIIAVLIGLKADQRYALATSRHGCRRGSGGLTRKRIRFTGGPDGHAVIRDGTSNTAARSAGGSGAGAEAGVSDVDGADFLVWQRSVVVLTPETGNEFQRCARLSKVAGGDTNQDGTPSANAAGSAEPQAAGKVRPKRKLVANAILRPRAGSALIEDEGLFYFAKRPERPARIIGVLVALKDEQRYELGFSRTGCRKPGGLLRKRIAFTGGARVGAAAVVTDKATPKLVRRAKSVVVLTPETGNRFHACGRFDVEYSADGDDL